MPSTPGYTPVFVPNCPTRVAQSLVVFYTQMTCRPYLALPGYPRLWLKLAVKLTSVVVVAVEYSRRRVGRYIGNVFRRESGRIWLENVVCFGNESNIDTCRHSPWGTAFSDYHFSDVSISCGMMLVATIQVRATMVEHSDVHKTNKI